MGFLLKTGKTYKFDDHLRLPDDRSDVLAVELSRDVPLLEAVDDPDTVDHLAVLNDFQAGPLDDQIVQVPRRQFLDGDIEDESLAKPKYKRLPEIDCNHLEDGIFKIWEHEVFILAGKGVVRDQNGTETPIGEGTTVFIPGGENHCLINQGGDALRFICLIPTGVE